MRKLRFLAKVGLILIILFAAAVLFIDWRVEAIGSGKVISLAQLAKQKDYDCVIVPGALVYNNRTPSAMLQDRLDMAVNIYELGCTDRILVSGDHGQANYDEVNPMRQYLINAGIPAEVIFMDHAGFDTYDTLYRAQAVFGVQRAMITTQDFHLYRALYIGQQLGLDIQGIPCDYDDAYKSAWYRVREYPARVKAFLDCIILHADPVYTGTTIPISGDGRATLG